MYRVLFLSNSDSEYYKNNTLLFKVKRKKVCFGFKSYCEILNENNEVILGFLSSEFSFLYNELKIINHNLCKDLILIKNKNRYNAIIGNNIFDMQYNRNPFSKYVAKILINNNLMCIVERKILNFKFNFYFNFQYETNLETYVLIYFAMCSVGISDDI